MLCSSDTVEEGASISHVCFSFLSLRPLSRSSRFLPLLISLALQSFHSFSQFSDLRPLRLCPSPLASFPSLCLCSHPSFCLHPISHPSSSHSFIPLPLSPILAFPTCLLFSLPSLCLSSLTNSHSFALHLPSLFHMLSSIYSPALFLPSLSPLSRSTLCLLVIIRQAVISCPLLVLYTLLGFIYIFRLFPLYLCLIWVLFFVVVCPLPYDFSVYKQIPVFVFFQKILVNCIQSVFSLCCFVFVYIPRR